MPASYAGVPLVSITPEAAAYAETSLRLKDLPLFQHRHVKSQTLPRLTMAQTADWTKPRLGTLSWPTGASRWATGLFLASGDQLAAIRAIVFADGGYVPDDLLLDGGSGPQTFLLRLLPCFPVIKFAGDDPLYLLCLVDERYFWWDRYVTLSVETGETSWDDFYDALGESISVPVEFDTIAEDYLKPGRAWEMKDETAPPILDALAYSLGQRVVRNYDATVGTVNSDTSQAILEANLEVVAPLIAGGTLDIDDADPTDLAALIPGFIQIDFPNLDTGDLITKIHTSTLTHRNDETKVFRATGVSGLTDLVWTPTADLQTFTHRFATDWYYWRQCDSAYTFAGIQPWQPTGQEDTIEFTYRKDECSTRIFRGSYNDLTEDLLLAISPAEAQSQGSLHTPWPGTTTSPLRTWPGPYSRPSTSTMIVIPLTNIARLTGTTPGIGFAQIYSVVGGVLVALGAPVILQNIGNGILQAGKPVPAIADPNGGNFVGKGDQQTYLVKATVDIPARVGLNVTAGLCVIGKEIGNVLTPTADSLLVYNATTEDIKTDDWLTATIDPLTGDWYAEPTGSNIEILAYPWGGDFAHVTKLTVYWDNSGGGVGGIANPAATLVGPANDATLYLWPPGVAHSVVSNGDGQKWWGDGDFTYEAGTSPTVKISHDALVAGSPTLEFRLAGDAAIFPDDDAGGNIGILNFTLDNSDAPTGMWGTDSLVCATNGGTHGFLFGGGIANSGDFVVEVDGKFIAQTIETNSIDSSDYIAGGLHGITTNVTVVTGIGPPVTSSVLTFTNGILTSVT